jgi:uncharacterized repeat protein (TIGR03803 family)
VDDVLKRAKSSFKKITASNQILALTLLVVFAIPALHAQQLKVLYRFAGQPDGSGPNAAPLRDKHGNLYVTTFAGGTVGWGSVVELDAAGHETVLHSFTGGSDGTTPNSGLIMDANGNLYGTTYSGGSQHCFDGNGCGTVYELSPVAGGWKATILYAFKGRSDGALPRNGPLALDAAGNLYGTTTYGGVKAWPHGSGVVFKLAHTSRGWKEQVIHAFGAGSSDDGLTPWSGVVLDSNGNAFGTTYYGGSSPCACGTVYKIDSNGVETVLYSFEGGTTDGGGPMYAPVLDKKGNLYGTTAYGGDTSCAAPLGCGTVYKITAAGHETLLHIFTGYPNDGAFAGALVQDASGNLYGTSGGGDSTNCPVDGTSNGCGLIFEMNTKGKETVLYNFTGLENGSGPAGVNIYAGKLYGATQGGAGELFRVSK